jgi:hypothetical protein
MTARLYTLNPLEGFRPKTFAGHKNAVLGAYFSSDSKSVCDTLDSVTCLPIVTLPGIYGQPRRCRVRLESQAIRPYFLRR